MIYSALFFWVWEKAEHRCRSACPNKHAHLMAAGNKERERKREGERGEGVNGGESEREREREIYLNVHSKLSKPDSTTYGARSHHPGKRSNRDRFAT